MRYLMTGCLLTLGFVIGLTAELVAQEPPTEEDYYRIVPLPVPQNVVLEVSGLVLLEDGLLAVCSRRGEVYKVSQPLGSPDEMQFRIFARGLHEPLGLAERDGWLYATQRGEITRMKDGDGDGLADQFENYGDGWEISGDYHEYAFGSQFDKDGNIWVVLCLTGSFSSEVPYRGWCLRVTPSGEIIPTCSGLRSPGGIGANAEGDMFYVDNQGPWNGACSLKHLRPGKFLGHPGGNRWYELTDRMGSRPQEPHSESRMMAEAKRIPQLEPPAVYFPYAKMGQSAAGILCDTSGGKFGPFQNQLFVGDQTFSTVMRVYLEQVQGHYQGACFPFREGFSCGVISLCQSPAGPIFMGSTSRGWGSRGNKPYSLDRLEWTGATPFEVLEMSARRDGFELTFTTPADRATAADPRSYRMETYTYIYQSNYGSPEVDGTQPVIERVEVSGDGLRARLYIDKLMEGHVHELHMDGVRSAAGQPLLHRQAYYTLNYFVD